MDPHWVADPDPALYLNFYPGNQTSADPYPDPGILTVDQYFDIKSESGTRLDPDP